MMHPLTIIAVAFALDGRSRGQLRSSLGTSYDVTPAGAVLDARPVTGRNLQTNAPPTSLFETKAVATPSSFVEEGSPDSFADLDAKLKQLEEKTKAELAKLKQLEEKTKAE